MHVGDEGLIKGLSLTLPVVSSAQRFVMVPNFESLVLFSRLGNPNRVISLLESIEEKEFLWKGMCSLDTARSNRFALLKRPQEEHRVRQDPSNLLKASHGIPSFGNKRPKADTHSKSSKDGSENKCKVLPCRRVDRHKLTGLELREVVNLQD